MEAVSHLHDKVIGACSYTKTVREEYHMAWNGGLEKRVDVTDSGNEAVNGISQGPNWS